MRELQYVRYPPRKARKKPGPTARKTAKRRRAEGAVAKTVRAACVERDGYCRVGSPDAMFVGCMDNDRALSLKDLKCSGPSEWAHLENMRRGRTRGMKPELRHTTAGTAMLCRTHHRAYDAATLRIASITGKGADGPITWSQR